MDILQEIGRHVKNPFISSTLLITSFILPYGTKHVQKRSEPHKSSINSNAGLDSIENTTNKKKSFDDNTKDVVYPLSSNKPGTEVRHTDPSNTEEGENEPKKMLLPKSIASYDPIPEIKQNLSSEEIFHSKNENQKTKQTSPLSDPKNQKNPLSSRDFSGFWIARDRAPVNPPKMETHKSEESENKKAPIEDSSEEPETKTPLGEDSSKTHKKEPSREEPSKEKDVSKSVSPPSPPENPQQSSSDVTPENFGDFISEESDSEESDKNLISSVSNDSFSHFPDSEISSFCHESMRDSRDINGKFTEPGETELHLILFQNESLDVIRNLLEHSNLNIQDDSEATFLHWAAGCSEHPEVIEEIFHHLLIRLRQEIRMLEEENRHFSLTFTERERNESASEEEEIRNIILNKTDQQGQTPLHWAVKYNKHPDIIRVLISLGANPLVKDNLGQISLDLATKSKSDEEIIEILVQETSKLMAKEDLESILYSAIKDNNLIMIQSLIQNQLNLLYTKDSLERNLLHFAVKSNSNVDILNYLIGAHISLLNAKDYLGQIPLHSAGRHSSEVENITALIKAKPESVNTQDNMDRIPLHFAAGYNTPKIVEALLKENLHTLYFKDQSQTTALHWAARYNQNEEVIRTLIQSGANLNLKDQNGNTPLHLAAQHSLQPEVIRMLICSGSDPNETNSLWRVQIVGITSGQNAWNLMEQNPSLTESFWEELNISSSFFSSWPSLEDVRNSSFCNEF